MKAWSLCAIISMLLASSANAAEEAPQPDPKVFEAIGMMFAQGSGLSRMEFSDKEIDLIISGIVKGMKLKEVPPEVESLQPKIEAIMRVKMEIARKAKESAGAKTSSANKAKGKQFPSRSAKEGRRLKRSFRIPLRNPKRRDRSQSNYERYSATPLPRDSNRRYGLR